MSSPQSTSNYISLPPEAEALLAQASAPPRLVAHLILVHDVAVKLYARIREAFPVIALDGELISFGAAIHDFGKSEIPQELSQPGKEHETLGFERLRQMGVSDDRARYAYTHGNWDLDEITLEDLLVALADNCWKGKRVDPLEMKIVELLSSLSNEPAWSCYSKLDAIVESLSRDADTRLAWQASFEVE